MDALAFLLVSLPIFYPLVMHMGYDPIWFGQVISIVTTMGAIMPPIGICCYVVAGMAKDIPLSTVFKGGMYYHPLLYYLHYFTDALSLLVGFSVFQFG